MSKHIGVIIVYWYKFNIENWLSSVLIGSISSNSEAIVAAQTALSTKYNCFQNKMAPENPLEIKPQRKHIPFL
jgi:hypothetical protein